ncbi:hypothetical protein [Alkalihalobacillus sp. BA299]|uniref:hypothetical protein n=1 Tax=Alkalihalobacillus sp. BA299 TaxID=2815938 RepID=UPI001ADCCDD3|nr:hypothetical protein [Alkalihalobacillus sp. BA299]
MVALMKNLLNYKGGSKIQNGFNRIMFSDQVAFIREEWSKYPVNLDIKFCNSFEHIDSFPRSCEKRDFIIGVIPWDKRNVDVIIYTKRGLSCEHILDKRFENLTREEIQQLGLLPNKNRTICTNCNEFSTQINIDAKCQDCI